MPNVVERPYEASDLTVKKAVLLEMVKRQRDKWPLASFNPSKIRVETLREHLLSGGFTKQVTFDNTTLEPPSIAVAGPQSSPAPATDWPENMTNPSLLEAEGSDSRHERTETTSPRTAAPRLTAALLELQASKDEEDKLHRRREDLHACRIRLLIEEWVDTSAVKRHVEDVDLRPLEVHPAGDWDIRATEVLCALQNSFSAIEGVVKVSVPDTIDPEYRRCFANMARDGNPLVNTETNPAILRVRDASMKLIIEHIPSRVVHMRETAHTTRTGHNRSHDNSEIAHTAGHKRNRDDSDNECPLQKATNRKQARTTAASEGEEREDVEWLKRKAATRPGYIEFCANRNRKLNNPARARFWSFAACFSSTYYKTYIDIPGICHKVRVTKKAIMDALGVGTTALAEAENMSRIMDMYGEHGGLH
ncbi:hypothetical protein D9615_010588 [Tricholomella constricta]|uniref:Uncharacterized protein n=1 Tax=Tricholomella constricta TaxID=117010 RepID=A0A8H5LRS5_9AGAR|nr:hypothetical protein D9615_010588 [Tricholomella constricta]